MKKQEKKHNSLTEKMMDFQARCRQAGLKITPQRLAVYQELVKSREHPSADMLYRKVRKTLPNISLDTVNRTLLTFAEIGAAFIVEGSGDAKRFDGQLDNHQHFKCVKCKRIINFCHKPFDNIKVPADIEESLGYCEKPYILRGFATPVRENANRNCILNFSD